jgi:hypothetical protein
VKEMFQCILWGEASKENVDILTRQKFRVRVSKHVQ